MMMSILRSMTWLARRGGPKRVKFARRWSGRARLSKSVGFAELGFGCSSTATRCKRESLRGEFPVRHGEGGVPVCPWDLADSSAKQGRVAHPDDSADNAGGAR
jgi:hypothetical protein